MTPAAQKTDESLGSPHPSGTIELSGEAPGDGPTNARMEGSSQLSCSLKKEPSAPSSPMPPAQSPERHIEHQEPASTSFHPTSIQDEWVRLNQSQELYWNSMLEKYGTVVSLGMPPSGAELEPGTESGLLHRVPEALGNRPGVGTTMTVSGLGQACVSPLSAGQHHAGENPSGPMAGVQDLPPLPPAPRKPYTCEQCGCSFDWKSVFIIHHHSHTGRLGPERLLQVPRELATRPPWRLVGPRSYSCKECGHSFSWKSQLVIHLKSHAGHQRHFCGDCGHGFDWKSQLVIHRKSHRPEAP